MFISERCKHNNNKILILKNLSFLLSTSFIIITRFIKFIIKNKSDEYNVDINFSKDIKKRLTSTFKAFKEIKIKKFDFIDIAKIDALAYYYLIRNKENKLFSLIINEIYDDFIKSFDVISQIKRDHRILINKPYLCDFEIKYKKCYKFYISKNTYINNIKILIL